ncbi:MAG: hypothetical protein ACXQS3_02450 [Candidatus Methanofastidiosia archaeon]
MKFTVYSNKWKHENVYGIKFTNNGWYVKHAGINGDCDKRGEPYLYDMLKLDNVDYPPTLGHYLEYLWYNSIKKEKKWIQEKLDELCLWIKSSEKLKLDSDFWKDVPLI